MAAFQEIDQVSMAAPVTKGSWLIHDKTRIPEYVATAFRTAMSGRPGPVHLTLPIDLQDAEISEDELPQYLPQEYRAMGRPQGDPSLIEEAAALLRGARRPVIIAGNPARYSVAPEQLEKLAETAGIPVFTVEQARGLLDDEQSPLLRLCRRRDEPDGPGGSGRPMWPCCWASGWTIATATVECSPTTSS